MSRRRSSRCAMALVACLLVACGSSENGSQPEPPDHFFERPLPPVGEITAVTVGGEPFHRRVLATSLQGLVNRKQVRLYLVNGEYGPSEQAQGEARSNLYWLELYAAAHGVTVSGSLDLGGAIQAFAGAAEGYLLVDDVNEPWTVNAATSLAGLRDLLIATEADAPALEAYGLTLIDDLRGRWPTSAACIRETFDTLYPELGGLALGILNTDDWRLRDFLIQNRLFTAYGRPHGDADSWEAIQEILAATPGNQPVFGYLSSTSMEEYGAVTALSTAGKYLVPSDTTPNLSVHSAIRATLPQPDPVGPADCGAGTLRVAVAISDGDNLGLPVNRYIAEEYWLHAERGTVPMGWSVAPALVHLAPAIAGHYMEQRGSTDELVSMLGIGYAHPTSLPDHGPFLAASFEASELHGMISLWLLDPALQWADLDQPIWDDLSSGASEHGLSGLLLGYGSVAGGSEAAPPDPWRTQAGTPVLLAANEYEDTPELIEQRIRDALVAWRGGGTADVLFLRAAAWNNDFAGLVQALDNLAGESQLTLLTPSQLLGCL